jgi:Tfp pilus assembly protein PilF
MLELRRIESAGFTGAYDEIRMDYAAKAKANPSDPMPRVYLAWLTLPSDDAWNQLKNVAQIFPDNPWVHYGMGRIYSVWKMRDQAVNEVAPLLKRDPKFYPAMLVLGDVAAQKGDVIAAEGYYRQALLIEDEPLVRTSLGLLLLKEDKRPEAAEQLKASTKAWPEQPVALAALVPLLAEAKDPALLDSATAVAALRPKDVDARRKLADLRYDAQDHAGALKDYERALKLGVPDKLLLERMLTLYVEVKDLPAQEKMLLALAQLESTVPGWNLRLAALKLSTQDLVGADAQFDEALKRDPANVEAHLGLARLKVDEGALYLALGHYRAARVTDPANAEAVKQVTKLESDFKLPKRQLKGNVNGINWAVSASLDKFFAERRAARPALAGSVKLKLKVNAKGTSDGVELVEDTLKDPLLLGHVIFSLKDAEYWDKRKLEATLEFTLGKKKK